MQSLSSMLGSLTVPNRTPEEWAAIRRANEEEELERQEKERKRRIVEAQIPARFVKADLSTCKQEIRDWADSPTDGLLLQGPNRTGKTHSACAVLLHMAGTASIRFASMKDILDDCKASYTGSISERDVIAKYSSVGALCIDDMGKERLTEWSLPIVFAIFDKRYSNERPTIVTMNLTGRELFAKMVVGDDDQTARAVVSRMNLFTRVPFTEADRRG